MELLIHSGDDYVASFEPESLAALVGARVEAITIDKIVVHCRHTQS